MIRVIITGPQGSGKTKLAQVFLKHLRLLGFPTAQVFTTNIDVPITEDMNREEE